MVITNAAYNNPSVKGLVYVAAFAPQEGQSLGNFVDPTKLPKGFLIIDKGGLAYINPKLFHDSFAQDVNSTQADIMAAVQKPINTSILAKNLALQLDRMIPPAVEHLFAKQMNATTISLPSSRASLVSHPNEIAQLILNATRGSSR